MYSKHRLQLERLYAEHAKEERTIKELYKDIEAEKRVMPPAYRKTDRYASGKNNPN